MICKTWEDAKRQAQANADTFQDLYMVFRDTSGNARCEIYNPRLYNLKQSLVFHPRRPAPGD